MDRQPSLRRTTGALTIRSDAGQPPPAQDDPSNTGSARRTGALGWWINLTAPPWPDHPLPIAARERLRKAELTSVSILAIFACLIALVSNSLADPATAGAVAAIAISLLIAAILNRTGRTRIAAYIVPSVMLLIMMANLSQGSIGLIDLPIYDLMVVPIILVSIIGDRRAPRIFAAIAIAFVIGSYVLSIHATITLPDGKTFDGIAYEQTIYGIFGMLNRHVALLFFAALFGWMGARSVEQAIARADRAEEIARLEHAFAEQTRQLEYGIREIQQVHVRVANGDYNARAPLTQDHILWQIAYALNNL